MNIFELKIWDDERRLCSFYTVQKDGDSENETDKFFANRIIDAIKNKEILVDEENRKLTNHLGEDEIIL